MQQVLSIPRPGPFRRLRVSLALALTALTLSSSPIPGVARSPDPDRTAPGDLVDVRVKVDGRATPLYFAPGRFDRRYFQAFHGRNYSLVVRNRSDRRVGVLIAVDGLNVVNGERSSLSPGEAMYVLDPFEQAEIRGWRTSLRDVRRFVFVDEERSYAERSGQANGDMGWIRVLAFRELGSPDLGRYNAPWRDGRRDFGESRAEPEGDARGRAEAPPAARAPASEPQLKAEGKGSSGLDSNPGTGWGERSHDPVNRTWFTAESRATDHFVLRYEYASGLRALGIDLRRHHDRLWEREEGVFGFARPPRD